MFSRNTLLLVISIFVFLTKINAQSYFTLVNKIKLISKTDTINQFHLYLNIKKELERNPKNSSDLINLYYSKANNEESFVYSNLLKGQYYFSKSIDSTKSYFNTAKSIAIKYKDKKLIAQSNMGLAAILLVEGKFDESLKIYYDCLTVFDKEKDKQIIVNLYNNIGSIFIQIENYDKAIEYYLKANVLYKSLNDLNGLGLNYQKFGYINFNKLNFEIAKQYFDTAYYYYKINNDSIGIANIYLKYGDVEFEYKNNYYKALEYYNKAKSIYCNLNSVSSQIFVSESIAEAYFKIGNIEQAESTILSAVEIANKIGFNYKVPDLYLLLHDIYFERKDYNKALQFYKIYKLYQDSIYINNKNLKINELEIKHKTLEKDNELLKNKTQISENENIIQKQKTNIYLGLLILIVLIVIVFFVLYFIRKQKKLNTSLIELNDFKSKVFTIISHDLRSPVGSIVSHSKEPQTKAKALSAMHILDNLLNWSYPQLTKKHLKPVKIILEEILEEAIQQTNYLRDSKDQKLKIEIDSDFVFTGDYHTTLVILRNLISNASMYSASNDTIFITQQGLQINIQNKSILNPEKGLGIGMKVCDDLAKQNMYQLSFTINNNIATTQLTVC